MRTLSFFKSQMPVLKKTILQEVYEAKRPHWLKGAFSGDGWRHSNMGETLNIITNSALHKELREHAENNLNRWAKNRKDSPMSVEVIHQDWGDAVHAMTQKHGVVYAVLNMANSLYPGGGVLEGGSAQEENMWRRSDCALSLLSSSVYFDKSSQTFLYTDDARKLLEAQVKMSDEERDIVRERCPDLTDTEHYKVFMSPETRVCFKGPEIFVTSDSTEGFAKIDRFSNTEFSYALLSTKEIFPFRELRSAAPEPMFQDDDSKKYEQNLSRRIAAQLDTLILNNQPRAVLGAWGCGAFKNAPQLVADIYKEEIQKRAHFFEHVVFAIINVGRSSNFSVFQEALHGMSLGNDTSLNHSHSP